MGATLSGVTGSSRPILALWLLVLLAIAAPFTTTATAQDIEIRLESFGIDGSFQPGGYVPVRISMRSDLAETTAILVSFEVPNSDGDIERYTRQAVLAPGQTTARWLYPRIPPSAAATGVQGQIFNVRIYLDEDGTPGRELAAMPVSGATAQQVGTPIEMTEDLMLIVGTGQLGLRGYQQTPSGMRLVPSLNERTILVNTQPEDLPDRWQGLSSFSRIIWGNASPQALGLDEAAAIREWVERGGRLVIVLPESGNPWDVGGRGRTALADLLPTTTPTRLNEVPIGSLMQVLSKSAEIRNTDATTSIQVFDSQTLEDPWEPLAALPAPRNFEGIPAPSDDPLVGATYGIQRRLGFGWVTLVGIDADAIYRRQLQLGGLPQTDVFWNRLLGRRGTMPSIEAYQAYQTKSMNRTAKETFDLGNGEFILNEIKIGGPSAALGVLIALGLFVAYWILAGPASFAILRARGLVRYSWVTFVGIACIFTGIALLAAWIGRAVLRADAPVQHLTFLDVISGEETARATSWFSAYLPDYGETEMRLPGATNLLSTWSPPPNGSIERFPNSDTFEIETDSPNAFGIPSRATSAHFVAQWKGQLEGDWKNVPSEQETPIKQLVYPGTPSKFALQGVIRHGLPWQFSRIRLIEVSPFRTPLPSYIVAPRQQVSQEQPLDAIPNHGLYVGIDPTTWPTGGALDLSTAFGEPTAVNNGVTLSQSSLEQQLQTIFDKSLRNTLRQFVMSTNSWTAMPAEVMEMYALFDMLPQPIYLNTIPNYKKDDEAIHRLRWLGRETDSSSWFLRPCVMLVGILKNVPTPIPIEIDGERVESSGTVVLRWIHPLPVDDRMVAPLPRTLRPFQFPLPTDNDSTNP